MRLIKRHWIIASIMGILVVARVLAPHIILVQLQKSLADFSYLYSIRLNNINLSFFRAAYSLGGLEVIQKKTGSTFLKIQSIDVSLAWRKLFKGQIVTDVDVQLANLDFDKSLAFFVAQNTEQSKKDATAAKNKLFPINIERLTIRHSELTFRPFIEKKINSTWQISDFELISSNLTPMDSHTPTVFLGSGTLLSRSKFKFVGEVFQKVTPVGWRVESELQNFDLKYANALLVNIIPLTFKSGRLEAYSETRSMNNKLVGYVRVFAKDLKIMGDKYDFQGPKHFFVELFGTFLKFLLENRKDRTVATQIDFGTSNGRLQVNAAKAIKLMVDHASKNNLAHKNRTDLPLEFKELKDE